METRPLFFDDIMLKEAFEPYGVVSKAQVILDRATGRSRGFGFVEMPNCEEAKTAINVLNQTELDGRTIVVKMNDSKPGSNNRGGYRGGGDQGGYRGGGDRGGYGGGGGGYRGDGN